MRFTEAQHFKLTSVAVSKTKPSYAYLLISQQGKHAEYFLNTFNAGLNNLHASGEHHHLMAELLSGAYSN